VAPAVELVGALQEYENYISGGSAGVHRKQKSAQRDRRFSLLNT
jgi:hypothetical protein